MKPIEPRILLPGQTPDGAPILSTLVKRTYDILNSKRCRRAKQDVKLHPGDVFYGDPANSSVRFESDHVPFKPGTDVVLNGTAFAPKGQALQQFDIALQVHNTTKRLRVIGDRKCQFVEGGLPVFTEPVPFKRMSLLYERAYGGVDIRSNVSIPFPYMRNPLGRGFAIRNLAASVDRLELPNLEDPSDLLTPQRLCCGDFSNWQQQPMPAGLGWLPRGWLPRSMLAGILPGDRALEQELRTAYSKLVPVEHRKAYATTVLPTMNFKFFHGASQGLAVPFLNGDEGIRTTNLSDDGELMFRLPGETPAVGIDIGNGILTPEVFLQTVMIRLDDRQLDLVWRAAIAYPGLDWLPQLRTLAIEVQ